MRGLIRQWMLKPQDIAVAFKLLSIDGAKPSFKQLGKQLRLSQFEVHAAFNRLQLSKLLSAMDGRPIASRFADFICFGAIYSYPAIRSELTIGVATAHAAMPLSGEILSSSNSPPVWPYPAGKTQGEGLLPLYQNLPEAALEDLRMYEFLALFDALRIGQARERNLAAAMMRARIDQFGA